MRFLDVSTGPSANASAASLVALTPEAGRRARRERGVQFGAGSLSVVEEPIANAHV